VVPAERTDATRFNDLCAQASLLKLDQPEKAVGLFREAIGLWRGPALQNVPHGPMRDKGVARLERQRMLATTSLIEISLNLGKHVEVIPELESLVLDNPLEERLYIQLMSALNQVGRPSDALEFYQLARLSLAQEVGLSPSPALEKIMLRILRRA
jgi:SARP family transcriptional regulator, regulator of embCAB operon